MTRAADVMMKERRKLIIVPRETPYNLLHLLNIQTPTMAGDYIMPSFYSKQTLRHWIDTVVDRILDLVKPLKFNPSDGKLKIDTDVPHLEILYIVQACPAFSGSYGGFFANTLVAEFIGTKIFHWKIFWPSFMGFGPYLE